jgi:hypothetical protein
MHTAARPRVRVHLVVLWTLFTAAVLTGLVLSLRFSHRIAPLLDVVTDR